MHIEHGHERGQEHGHEQGHAPCSIQRMSMHDHIQIFAILNLVAFLF